MAGARKSTAAATPITIFGSKLMSWHRADLGLTFSSGALVSDWADQSGNGRTFSEATPGNQPNQTVLGGGQSALHFDATYPCKLTLSGTSYGSPSAFQLFRIFKRNADPPPSSAKAGLDDFGTYAAKTHAPYTDGVIYDCTGLSSTRMTCGDPATSLSSLCMYESLSTASKWQARVNGTLLYDAPSGFGVGVPASPIIGGAPSAGIYMDGEIAEVIALNAEASGGERTAFAAYVLDLYGLTVT